MNNEKCNFSTKDYKDLDGFKTAVDNLVKIDSITRIDKALRLAHREMFSPSSGGRPHARKLLVLLTDGAQSVGFQNPVNIATEMRRFDFPFVSKSTIFTAEIKLCV